MRLLILLGLLQASREDSLLSSPYSSLTNLSAEETGDFGLMEMEKKFQDMIKSTMVPRYLQLGNQTVDLNTLFKVPQEGEELQEFYRKEISARGSVLFNKNESRFYGEFDANSEANFDSVKSQDFQLENDENQVNIKSSDANRFDIVKYKIGENGHHSDSASRHPNHNSLTPKINEFRKFDEKKSQTKKHSHENSGNLIVMDDKKDYIDSDIKTDSFSGKNHGVSHDSFGSNAIRTDVLSERDSSVSIDFKLPHHHHHHYHKHDHSHGPHFDHSTTDNSSVTVRAGHTAHLDCKVSYLRDKTVSWVRRRPSEPPLLLTVGLLTYSGDSRFSLHFRYPSTWRLTLRQARKTDEGRYECQVNTHPPSVREVCLNVEAPEVCIVDELGVALREQYYEAGSTLRLACHVRGVRARSVLWLHGARALHVGTRAQGGVSVRTQPDALGGTHSALRLSRLAAGDAGNYSCYLAHDLQHTVLVHVINEESLAELQGEHGTSANQKPAKLLMLMLALFIIISGYS